VSFAYRGSAALRDVSLSVPEGKFATLLGPSGCGKSTLLNLIGGYLTAQSGAVRIRGQVVNGLPPEQRQLGMVFQSYALFPHLRVRDNVSFGLDVRRQSKAVVRDRVQRVLQLVGLTDAEAQRYPHQLSGGQQQRVALARALAIDPPVLLLDEPFSSLDRQLRQQLRGELAALHRRSGVTTLMVTHDQEEALALSDLVGVMCDGRLLQFGSPRELYEHPRTPFVAKFLGDANLLDSRWPGLRDAPGLGDDALVLVRPEQVTLGGSTPARVTGIEYLGTSLKADVVVECDDLPRQRLVVRSSATLDLAAGDRIGLAIPPVEALWVIPECDHDASRSGRIQSVGGQPGNDPDGKPGGDPDRESSDA